MRPLSCGRSSKLTAPSRSSQYSNEAYDYPPNIKETFSDLGRTVSEKVTLLSSATSPAEAQAALTAPPSAKPQPKTFNHAIARASLASSQVLHQQHTGAGEDPLATALEKYALTMERVGEARLAQDAQIQSRFLAGWNTTLNTNLNFATRARKNVEKSRLTLDSTKARLKGTTWKLAGPGSPRAETHDDHTAMSLEAQEEIEKAEDEFVTQTEEAVGVMKNVRKSDPDPGHRKPTLLTELPGPGHARASPQPGRAACRSDRVPQKGLRDFERACSHRRWSTGRARGQFPGLRFTDIADTEPHQQASYRKSRESAS